jgi:hypothetical protein
MQIDVKKIEEEKMAQVELDKFVESIQPKF